ncbi:hypothetical protein U1Q18_009783 [Sarracenia purpurea var. burkii]
MVIDWLAYHIGFYPDEITYWLNSPPETKTKGGIVSSQRDESELSVGGVNEGTQSILVELSKKEKIEENQGVTVASGSSLATSQAIGDQFGFESSDTIGDEVKKPKSKGPSETEDYPYVVTGANVDGTQNVADEVTKVGDKLEEDVGQVPNLVLMKQMRMALNRMKKKGMEMY